MHVSITKPVKICVLLQTLRVDDFSVIFLDPEIFTLKPKMYRFPASERRTDDELVLTLFNQV
jgi:hypothetical protein